MKRLKIFQPIIPFLIFVLGTLFPGSACSDDNCANGAYVPAFLAGGVDPNLLLIIDNSGSMLDLAYIDTDSQCFDDTYDPANAYAGYFETNVGYGYDFNIKQFVPLTDAQVADYLANADFKNSDLAIMGAVSDGVLTSVTGFGARGNFLNWAAASKLDIQKDILTGGKYDDATSRLIMESRGCGERRFVKQVTVVDSGGTINYLTLGIRPPREQQYDPWEDNKDYVTGDIVTDFGSLYIATSDGTSSGLDVLSDTGVTWAAYHLTRWTDGVTYPAGGIVSDPAKANTIDEGRLYITATGGTADGTGVDDDTGITDWVPYDLTHIEIFKVSTTAFNNDACEAAVEELASGGSQGTIKQNIDECMGYSDGGNQGQISNFMAAFNHAIHNCWYTAKHGIWPPGAGPVQAIMPACEAVYEGGIDPWDITTDDRGYVCFGIYDADPANQHGYVGRCWNPGVGAYVCTKTHPMTGVCQKWEWVGSSTPAWDAAGYASVDECIEQALMDYCGLIEIPEVIDPSDQIGDDLAGSETFWNIPAVLVDSGVVAQLDEPLAVLEGYISHSETPSGLIKEFDEYIRMGAMIFNSEGSDSECDQPDPFVLYNCADPSNMDGGKIIADIDQSAAHTADLVSAINDIKATSWTPLAEVMYNAIGYYAQNSAIRINNDDFQIGEDYDPIIAWCQDNNILIITEGASTADRNNTVETFIETVDQNDADSEDAVDCGVLSGSPFLDDLTYFAKNSEGLYLAQLDGNDKQNIKTHIVVAGTLRSTGADECSPDVLLEEAAVNGGTTLYTASDPAQLEETLRDVFWDIRSGAAAGSAASVISSSRSGEGATYQAIFWPKIELPSGARVEWTGEVHSLFVDGQGLLYEDTDSNRTLEPGIDKRVIIYYDEASRDTKACIDGQVNADGTCDGTSADLSQVRYLWSAAEWLSGISPIDPSDADQDILVNRTIGNFISTEKKRYIFTWNDLNNDGIVDTGEVLDFDAVNTEWDALTVDASRGPVTMDFGVETTAELVDIIEWVRGLDQEGLRSRELPYDFDQDGAETDVTWRLGDVIHSTPMCVAAPAENYHLLYNDESYAPFAASYKKRRHVIYFGGNDGMLHAVNGGFYDEKTKRFCRGGPEPLTDSNLNGKWNEGESFTDINGNGIWDCRCLDEDDPAVSSPELGAELWAYVPYNLLPHLKCLTEEGYEHKYYVDQRMRIFDVQIFAPDDVHINGWGTILVGSMGFGGAKIRADSLDTDHNGIADYPTDKREFASAYFVIDITNPEEPPVLLGEMTRTVDVADNHLDFGYTTAIPAMVSMNEGIDVSETDWYLMLGTGPTDLDGKSTQNARLAVFPIQRLVDGEAFRISDAAPTDPDEVGCFPLSDANSFISDVVTVDFDIADRPHKTDVVYFGTVSGTWGDWGGKFYRLVVQKRDAGGAETITKPSEWSSLLNPLSLDNPLPLIDVGRPVTAAANATVDGKNHWVYFGTGRFFDRNDKSDVSSNAQETFYGIKEPRTFFMDGGVCKGNFTWETVEKAQTGINPGSLGLTPVGGIRVSPAAGDLSCSDGTTDCLPMVDGSPITKFTDLEDYIVGTGTGCIAGDPYGTDGWYREFPAPRERNLGQATVLGEMVTFTTYQPYNDVCLPEGLSYLYGVYYLTGTAYKRDVFRESPDGDGNVTDRIELGRGLAKKPNIHVGDHEGTKAFVQTSTGAIREVDQPGTPGQPKSGMTGWSDEE